MSRVRKHKVLCPPSVEYEKGRNILSTSRGIMSDSEARKLSVDGEVLCSVF